MTIRRVLSLLQRALLALAPRSFRRDFAQDIVADSTQQMDDVAERVGNPAAWRHGLAALGDVGKVVAQERREARTGAWSDLRGDLKYALRGFRRDPGFSLTAVMTLALGIGLTSAIFAFADGYLFRPLPFPGGDRAFMVRDPDGAIVSALRATDLELLRGTPVARKYGFVEWGTGNTAGEAVIGGRRIPVLAFEVSRGFRDTLALPLVMGRDFTAEDHIGGELVAWLSHRFWMQAFGGDRAVIGQILPIEGVQGRTAIRVVGVLGPEVASFDLNNRPPDLVMPERRTRPPGPMTLAFPFVVVPEGTTVQVAVQEMAAALQAVAPGNGKPRVVRLRSLREIQVEGGRPTARVFLAGALLVLLLASINLVHLLLARGAARSREAGVRAALGASRWRVARVFLVESVALGAVGTAAGLALGASMAALIGASVPRLPTAGRNLSLVPMMFDGRVMVVAGVLGLVIALLGGVWPAWRTLRRKELDVARGAAGTARLSNRFSRVVLTAQLTVATVVVAGTVFIGMGIYRYLTQSLGFDYRDRLTVSVAVPSGRPPAGAETAAALDAVRAVAGVSSAAMWNPGEVRGTVTVGQTEYQRSQVRPESISPGYFETWGMALERGRWFGQSEFHAGADVAVVDVRAAQLLWPDADAVGQTIRSGERSYRVVGVFRSLKWQLDREPTPAVYLPSADGLGRPRFIVWSPGSTPEQMADRIAVAVSAATPGATVSVKPTTFESLFERSFGEARFQAPVVALFGVLAVVLAGVGVFGLVSYLVERRRREFGVRLALGAGRSDIWRMVVSESVYPAVIGLVLGSAGALALESVVEASVFGWRSRGPLTIALVSILLVAVAVIAALVPAARATRIDPAMTLRAE